MQREVHRFATCEALSLIIYEVADLMAEVADEGRDA